MRKKKVACKSTSEEVSFEWSHERILSTGSNVRTTLRVFIIESGSRTELTHDGNWNSWLIASFFFVIRFNPYSFSVDYNVFSVFLPKNINKITLNIVTLAITFLARPNDRPFSSKVFCERVSSLNHPFFSWLVKHNVGWKILVLLGLCFWCSCFSFLLLFWKFACCG